MDKEYSLNGRTVAVLSLGCKVNSYESDAMKKSFLDAGAVLVDFSQKADIYVVNTCSVTNIADRKSRQMLHRAKHLNPSAVVIAAGCYAQLAGEELLADGCVDMLIGNNRKKNIVPDVLEYMRGGAVTDIVDIGCDSDFEELVVESAFERCRAYIKIQDGCNQFCSYCIIPYARGRIRSRSEADIAAEVRGLAAKGYKEIVLTGIHISSYGLERIQQNQDFEHNHYLIDLIKRLCRIEGIERIRLGSLEPRIITRDFVKALAEEDKVCPHFHLSLQSGCNATLKRMNRKYTAERFMEGCRLIREYFDRPSLTTDVIVGFPGETDDEFEQSISFLESVSFSKMHVFKYSRRKGTAADRMEQQVAEAEKARRSGILQRLDARLGRGYLECFIGGTERVLFEETVLRDGAAYALGHNERYARIAVRTGENLENIIKNVEVQGFLDDSTLLAI